MCGICGVATTDVHSLPIEQFGLERMVATLRHRGPDDDGYFIEPGVALGMRRLSIIDVAGSKQPIANESGNVHVVMNGEIYNYRELRESLRRRGHRFSTDGDTEVVVHLYEEHGEAFARHLRGMFAIAVWDSERKTLVLARDHAGVKPLYYSIGPRGLSFASEVKALLAGGLVAPRLSLDAAELFMAYGYVPGPLTLFDGVLKLPPASTLVWRDGTERLDRYWEPWPSEATLTRSWAEDQERLLELLRESVVEQMVSDVPLGSMLSGGIDSSLVTALMAEASSGPVRTFAVGFAEDGRANELQDAARVASRLGCDHQSLLTSAADHPDLLDRALWHLEEPITDVSFVGFLLLSELARKSVTVALSGQGADELLGGYRKHQIAAVADMAAALPARVRRMGLRVGRRFPDRSTAARGFAAVFDESVVGRGYATSRVVSSAERTRLFADEFIRRDGENVIADALASRVPSQVRTPLAQTLAVDLQMALVDNHYLYFDKASMAASLEVRVPFADPRLITFCMSLPDSRRVWFLRRKELLRRASAGLVDREVIKKRKRGFFVDALGAWLRVQKEESVRAVLLDERTRARGLYRIDRVEELLARSDHDGRKPHQQLFALFLLEHWLRLFIDSAPRVPVGRPTLTTTQGS